MEQLLIVKKCNTDNVDDILMLQDTVFETLGDNVDILRKNTKEMFDICVKKPNISLGLYDGNALVGIAILVDPKGTEEDILHTLKVVELRNLKACNFKLVMLKKEYRGMGFQSSMFWLMEQIAMEQGYECICATVSPDNVYSRNNFIKNRYVYDHTQSKYGGLTRDVFYKILSKKEQTYEMIKDIDLITGTPYYLIRNLAEN